MYYDVTLPIYQGMPVFPGDPKVIVEQVMKIDAGDSVNLHRISLGTHTGTHIDVPYHAFGQGLTVEKVNPEILIGSAFVVDFSNTKEITPDMLCKYNIGRLKRLLIKTGFNFKDNSAIPDKYPFLTREAAKCLVSHGIKLVGVDSPSVDPVASMDAHRELLGNGVIIIESLDLTQICGGEYYLICMPLPFAGMDGAPARVFVKKNLSNERKV